MASIDAQRSSDGIDTDARPVAGRRVPGRDRSSRRVTSRRPALPTRRAVLGAFLVTAAAVVTFAVATPDDQVPSTRYLVATRDLPAGALLTTADATAVAVDLPAGIAATVLRDRGMLDGAVTRSAVAAGALLTAVAVETAPPGTGAADPVRFREVSFAVPRARALLGDLAPGDRVDVVAAADDRTDVLVQQALVVATSRGDDGGLVLSDDVVITLALDRADDALAVAHGAATAELTVLRSTRATDRLPARFPTAAAASTTTAANPTTNSPGRGA